MTPILQCTILWKMGFWEKKAAVFQCYLYCINYNYLRPWLTNVTVEIFNWVDTNSVRDCGQISPLILGEFNRII